MGHIPYFTLYLYRDIHYTSIHPILIITRLLEYKSFIVLSIDILPLFYINTIRFYNIICDCFDTNII